MRAAYFSRRRYHFSANAAARAMSYNRHNAMLVGASARSRRRAAYVDRAGLGLHMHRRACTLASASLYRRYTRSAKTSSKDYVR